MLTTPPWGNSEVVLRLRRPKITVPTKVAKAYVISRRVKIFSRSLKIRISEFGFPENAGTKKHHINYLFEVRTTTIYLRFNKMRWVKSSKLRSMLFYERLQSAKR